MSDKGRTPPN